MPHSLRVWDDALYVLEAGRGALVRVDLASGRREDVMHCPGFARGLAFVSHYAVLTISMPRPVAFEGLPLAGAMKARGAVPWRGLQVVDLRNGDVAHWLRLEGDVTELFDCALIPQTRCPRALGPWSRELGDVVRGEGL